MTECFVFPFRRTSTSLFFMPCLLRCGHIITRSNSHSCVSEKTGKG